MAFKAVCLLALVALAAVVGAEKKDDANFCQGCRSLVSFAQRFNSSHERDEYKELFLRYCELFYPVTTDFEQGPCPMFVEALFYLIDHTDPVLHCDQIGACEPADVQGLQPSDDIYEYIEKSVANNNNNQIRPAQPLDTPVCEICEQLVTQVKQIIDDPETIDEMKRQLDGFCDYLRVVNLHQECRQFMDQYIDQAITFVKSIDPQRYCRSMQLCSGAAAGRPLVARARQQEARDELASLPRLADFQNFGIESSVTIGERPASVASQRALTTAPGCALCKTVVKELFHFLRENKTEANIVNGLEQVCGLLYSPGSKRDQCDSLIEAYTRELIQMLIDETDPEVICMILEQCNMSAGELAEPAVAPVPEDSEQGFAHLISSHSDKIFNVTSLKVCLECKIFIRYLRTKLGQPESQREMLKWLNDNVCSTFPYAEERMACLDSLSKHADTYFKALRGLLSPRAACRVLGACALRTMTSVFSLADDLTLREGLSSLPMLAAPASAVNQGSQQQKQRPECRLAKQPLELWGQLCDQCIDIVTQIDDYLSKHSVDDDVTVIIDKVCNKLPEGSARSECTYIIKAFGAQIVQAISTMDNPRELCTKVFLCQADKV